MSSIKNKIKFFENQNKQEPNTTKHKSVNTSNVKKNISHSNKIRYDVLNKPYISQTTYAFGRNQTTKIPIDSKKPQKPIVEKPIVEKPIVEKHIVEKPIVEKPIVEKPSQNINENSDNDSDNDVWMNSIIN